MSETVAAPADNPLLERNDRIPFSRIEPRHARPAVETAIAEARAGIEAMVAAEGPRTFDSIVERYQTLYQELVLTGAARTKDKPDEKAMESRA